MAKKKLNLANLQKVDMTRDKRKTIDVKGFEVEVDTDFRPSKVGELVDEIIKKIEEATLQGLNLDIASILTILLVKYFTSVDVPDDLETQFRMLKIMVDNDFIAPIVDSFDPKEIAKISQVLKANEQIVDARLDAFKNLTERTNELAKEFEIQ